MILGTPNWEKWGAPSPEGSQPCPWQQEFQKRWEHPWEKKWGTASDLKIAQLKKQ